ncbi:NAD(P)-binding protein [Phlegmacium glaucopus]|nr:NAD(P)-binding protein [Phlegmacium glaucopus]
MSSSSTPGIAILGAGIFAKEGHLPTLATLGTAAPPLKAIYSRSEKSAHDLAEAAAITLKMDDTPPSIYHDGDASANLDILLSRPDITAVLIALPISLQPNFILKALAAGKHVLSEKPVAPDVKKGLEVINSYRRLYKSKGLVWRVAENSEAEPGYRAVAAAIQSGKIGKVIFFKTLVAGYIDQESIWYKTPWRTIPDYQGGFLLDGGVHTIAALRVMLPHPLTHLSGFASLNKDYLKPHDTIHTIVKADDKFHGIVEITFASPTTSVPEDQMIITGTDGWLSVNQVEKPDTSETFLRIVIKSIVKTNGKPDEIKGRPDEEKEEVIEVAEKGILTEFTSFFDAISGKDDGLGLGDPLSALGDVAFIEAALNSNGELVDLTKMLQE